MFRRFRRRKPVALAPVAPPVEPAPAPIADLTGEQIFDQLYARLQRFVGVGGEWTLVRRGEGDTDSIFQTMVTHQIAAELTRGVLVERDLAAEPVGVEPIAMSWIPAPLMLWAEPAAESTIETSLLEASLVETSLVEASLVE
ncbi:hypothetical protein [Agromyces seonyuensis]|uniref:Uncharacterized protein n=1 Tax=Agromyces seonyuensis TaxID=2662446 RepID=A0A6I4P0J6_9MICO|nr:hypothetical protein [Agromyces seonyuensis]MWB98255.1 hypothetical protein [Agromyces seonyuensis]